MGDAAEMMLDGTLDCETGEYIDGESPGYPRSHAATTQVKCACGQYMKSRPGTKMCKPCYKEQHIDQLVDWVQAEKWDDVIDYCNGEVSTLDDDLEAALEYYIEANSEALWTEYFTKFGRIS